MALEALSTRTVRIVGWSDPRSYKGGTFRPPGSAPDDDGIKYDAGVSMQVCATFDEHDFAVLKVKTDYVGRIRTVVEAMKIGEDASITFLQRGGSLELRELVPVKVLANGASVK